MLSHLQDLGTWMKIPKETTQTLNPEHPPTVFSLTHIPGGTWGALLLALLDPQTHVELDIGLRVKQEKIMMILLIRGLEKGTLARRELDHQQTKGWPGLAAKAQLICLELGFRIVTERD